MSASGWKISTFASLLVLLFGLVCMYTYHTQYIKLEQVLTSTTDQLDALIRKHNEAQTKAQNLEHASLVYIHQIESLARRGNMPQ